ncbi:myosin light chain kinase, smooth muscle [Anabrus simplex]|uniref:myosin light chain kinase, smooth muscle n=1 Tax=Anabrus simplex TaxID=316456 RepID=UPI0034DD0555
MIQVDETDPIGEVDPSFPYRDVQMRRGEDMKDYYDLMTELGRGKFGTVYRCCEKSTGLQLAAKFVATPKREDRRNVEREVDIMRQLQHPRLIQLYDAFDNGKVMCVVLELIEGGELFERVIDDDFILTEKACTIFMRQICEGIEFIHQQNILHLDMKPENILCLTKTGNRIKIIDFGLARKYDPQKKLQVLFGTPEFVAPEIVNFDQIGFGTDMWSVGVICYVLLSGLSPFMGETDIETMANVTIAKYDFDDEVFNEISTDAKDFIQKLLLKDRDRRMTATQCLGHSWLKRKAVPQPVRLEELDVAKDNLRVFVERWNEHPNSPYQFDPSCHIISPSFYSMPSIETVASEHSLRGLSPSPCGSLSTSPGSVIENDIPENSSDNYYHLEPMSPTKHHIENLHIFERRASDSSCFIRNNIDTADRVNLADEIRKLSDKLYEMASLITPPSDSINNIMTENQSTSTSSMFTHNIDNGSESTFSSITSTQSSTGTVQRPIPFRPTPITNDSCRFPPPTAVVGSSSSQDESILGVRRPKFRLSHMNRDVPLGTAPPSDVANYVNNSTNSMSPYSSRNSSDTLPSCSSPSSSISSPPQSPDSEPGPPLGADLTKDLLLHLLNKWEDNQTHSGSSRDTGRKSISIEWTEEESLAQRTMNSLANYFQSARGGDKKHSVPTQFGV